jgi:uncharacterized membrane protein
MREKNLKRENLILQISTMVLGIWILLSVSAPLLVASQIKILQILGTSIYFFMDPVCHQLPDRSLFFGALPFPVCARCFSIYTGGFIVFLWALLKKPSHPWPKVVYLVFGSFIITEILSEKIQLYENLIELRMFSGFLIGLILFRMILETITNVRVHTQNG